MAKIVSRVGTNYQARVTRVGWEGSKHFAYSKYGSLLATLQAANEWTDLVDEALPEIPPKPVLQKANIYEITRDRPERGAVETYVDVYVGKEPGDTSWDQKFYFTDEVERIEAWNEAQKILEERNIYLRNKYENELAAWKKTRDQAMAKIRTMWPELKEMVQPPERATVYE